MAENETPPPDPSGPEPLGAAEWTQGRAELRKVFANRAKLLARRPRTAAAVVGEDHLVFRLDDVQLSVPVLSVRKILAPHMVTQIPCVPAHLSRVIQVGGKIVSLLDMRPLLGRTSGSSPGATGKVVLIEDGGKRLGIMATSIERIRPVDPKRLGPVNGRAEALNAFLAGITGDMVLVVDPSRAIRTLRFDSSPTTSKPTEGT